MSYPTSNTLELVIASDDPKAPELLDALRRSGMRDVTCECGRPFLTRSAINLCPPCRGIAPPDELTHAWRAEKAKRDQ